MRQRICLILRESAFVSNVRTLGHLDCNRIIVTRFYQLPAQLMVGVKKLTPAGVGLAET